MKLWGIWCKDEKNNKGDWLRSFGDTGAILGYETKRAACKRARQCYGFDSYTDAKRKGWVEVRQLN